MDKFIEESIRFCYVCSVNDKTVKATAQPVTTIEWPKRPWEKVAIDVRGPDASMGVHNRFAIVLIDYYSKWVEVELVDQVTTVNIIKMLTRVFAREGYSEYLVSDNGKQFTSKNFEVFLGQIGTEHIKTPLYHPMANGLVERFNRTLGSFIQTAKVLGGDLTERIQYMISMYNA